MKDQRSFIYMNGFLLQMLAEISQYSDIHHQQDQDYGSVQKLLTAFFESMSPRNDPPPRVNFSGNHLTQNAIQTRKSLQNFFFP